MVRRSFVVYVVFVNCVVYVVCVNCVVYVVFVGKET